MSIEDLAIPNTPGYPSDLDRTMHIVTIADVGVSDLTATLAHPHVKPEHRNW